MAAPLGRRALLAAAAAVQGGVLGLTPALPASVGTGGPGGERPPSQAEAGDALGGEALASTDEVAEWSGRPRARREQELELLEGLLSRWGAGRGEARPESARTEQEQVVAEADRALAILQGVWDKYGLEGTAAGAERLAERLRTARDAGGRHGEALGTLRRIGGGGPEPPRLVELRRTVGRPESANLSAAVPAGEAGGRARGGGGFPSLVAGTRYFGAGEQDYQKLLGLMGNLRSAGVRTLFVAVNVDQDRTNATARLRARQQPTGAAAAGAAAELRVEVMPVQPWSITAPLNAMLRAARAPAVNASRLMFVSVEISVTLAAVQAMVRQVDDAATLVAGVALPGHRPLGAKCSDASAVTATGIEGDTVPWNTLALWNVDKLSRTGFMAGADFQDPAGMEEAAPIALLQQLLGPAAARAKLLHLREGQGAVWATDFEDVKIAKKMATKRKRVELQLGALGGLQGTVEQWAPCAAG